MTREWSILGGGTAGLAYGFYFSRQRIPFVIYEAQRELGGASKTFRSGPFRYDSGAHRFHDKNRPVTLDLDELMKGGLKRIHAPSQIAFRGRFIDFPLSPLDLLVKLGPARTVRAGLSLARSRVRIQKSPAVSFADMACRTYGRYIAEAFLLNYSRKLWGKPASELSPEISGKRMKGLDVVSFLKEGFLGKRAKTEHLDGAFYYPQEGGIGLVADCLAAASGECNIRRGAEIASLQHNGARIASVDIIGAGRVPVENVLSTIPLSQLVLKLDPSPPDAIVSAALQLQYRDLILIALFLNKAAVTPNASLYFPSEKFPFTRVFEPRNRNSSLAPAGKTSLVAEIACEHNGVVASSIPKDLINGVVAELSRFFRLSEREIEGIETRTVPFAYPRLETAAAPAVKTLRSYLNRFENLRLAGRNGKFLYSHIHDHLSDARSFCSQFVQTGKLVDSDPELNPRA